MIKTRVFLTVFLDMRVYVEISVSEISIFGRTCDSAKFGNNVDFLWPSHESSLCFLK